MFGITGMNKRFGSATRLGYTVAFSALIGLLSQPAVAQPAVAIDAPAEGALATPPFAISGWAVDTRAVATTGIDAVAVYTGSMSAPTLLGYASFEARPDVAAAYQRPGYANAGYRFSVSALPSGAQQLGLMVHSTVSNAWHGPYVRNVVIPAAPVVTVDAIATGVQAFVLRGLAGDPASVSVPGISNVEIWADPTSGGPSVLVGPASLGFYRPDAAVYGSQYLYSGWERTVRGLSPASYVFRARALSSVSGIWGQAVSSAVGVANDPRIFVEAPANNAQVTTPVSVVGAVADLAASSGSGMSAVHVYVRPVGGAAIYAGQAVPNLPRPDLQVHVGNNPQFLNIGFQISNLPIPVGTYDLLTYANSLVSNQWTVAVTRVVVVAPAAAPVLVPPSGEYSAPISVSATSSTPGAVVRFTLDNTDPTDTSPILPPSTVVAAPGTGKVRAFAPGYLPSQTVTAAYSFRVAPLTVSPQSGTYEGPVQFSASTTSPDVVLKFTTDGTDPTEASAEFRPPITLRTSTSARLRAFRSGWQPSAVAAVTYTITPARPTFTVASGTYENLQTVAIETATPNGVIRYTTNGADPDLSSQVYAAPLSPLVATVIRARTYDALGATSGVSAVSVAYTVAAASLQPPPGVYTSGPLAVRLSSATANAAIRYTLDGTTPNGASASVPNGATVLVDATRTLLVQPYVAGWPAVAVVGGQYELRAPAPVVTPESGTYARPFSVVLSPAPGGGVTRYTTDGTVPTATSPLWVGLSNPANGAYAFVFRTFAPGWTPSDSVYRDFVIVDSVAPMPAMNPGPGDHAAGVSISITSSDPTAAIRVTLDGSVPTEVSQAYSGPITLSTPTIVRARAFKAGSAPSNIAGGLYRLRLQAPGVSPPSGTYGSGPSVTVSHPVPGVVMRYTTDRSDPTESSPIAPNSCCIAVSADDTAVKVRAFLPNWAPSDITGKVYFLGSAVIPPSTSSFSFAPSNRSVVAVGASLAITVSGTPLVAGSVVITRNGVDITRQFSVTPTAMTAANVVLAGSTVIEVLARDATGALTGSSVEINGAPNTFSLSARDTGGAPLVGAEVSLTDSSSAVPEQLALTELDGSAVFRVAASFAGNVTVQQPGFHSFMGPVTGSSLSVTLNAKTENFERGLNEWNTSYALRTFVRPHIEGFAPGICYINCPPAPLFASDTANIDMVVETARSAAPVTASRTFRFEPGARAVTVRYRFFSIYLAGVYRLTLSSPSTGQVLAEHFSSMSALQAQGQTYPGTLNFQSFWLVLSAPLPASATDLRLTIALAADNPLGTSTAIEVDNIQLQGVQMLAPTLLDLRFPGRPEPDPLTNISLGQRDPTSGRTEIWGTLRFSGTADRRISSVFLDVKDTLNGPARVSVPLDPAISGLLNVPIPAGGLTTGPPRRLFDFSDGQMQQFTRTDEERLFLRVRATDDTGAPVVISGNNALRVQKLVDAFPGLSRAPERDSDQCTDKGVSLAWYCRGDGWGRPRVQATLLTATAALAAVPGAQVLLKTGDISNLNGGHFPPHNSHIRGTNVDLDFDGYDVRDAAAARKVVQVANTLAVAARQYGIELTTILFGSSPRFEAELATLQVDGRPATDFIKPYTGHKDHFHANFKVP